MKTNKLIIISMFILGFFSCYFLMNTNFSDEVITNNEYIAASKNNALTMMLETDIDSNEYEVATSNEWPQEGYIFNAEMSACERGGKLSWDSETNRVVMASGSADKCYVYFDRYQTVSITNVTASNITNNSITLTVEATVFDSPITNYYFSMDNGLNYEESTSNTYTFNNLSTGTEYNFRVYAVDSNGISSNIYTLTETTSSVLYLANYIKNTVYTGDGNEGIYYHDGSGSYTNAAQEAGDNSYRYAGANPNNYVCFASDAETCPNDNLYRIIGVFEDQVKLIKHDYANSTMLGRNGDYHSSSYSGTFGTSSYYKGSQSQSAIPIYYWNDSTANNNWSQSNLNTVNLNTNYINYLNGINLKWNDMIETHTWKVGGGSDNYLSESVVKTAYNYEVGNNSSSTTYNAKIGLMYVSDYGYAASPANWRTTLINYDNNTNRNNNWMFMGLFEWTISRRSDYTNDAFIVNHAGVVDYGYDGYVGSYLGVRPSFYLYPWVIYSGGDGSSTSPFRLSIPDLISFSIDGTTYYFEDGMTWEEWVNSIYNIDNFVISNGYIYNNSNLQNRIANQNTGQFAEPSSEIDSTISWYWY